MKTLFKSTSKHVIGDQTQISDNPMKAMLQCYALSVA